MPAEKSVRFASLLEGRLLELVSNKFNGEPITPETLRSIRDLIREEISSIFSKSSHKLSRLSIEWLSNQYFKSIKLNNEQLIGDIIVINEHKLSDVSYDEICLLAKLFDETSFSSSLNEEFNRRTLS